MARALLASRTLDGSIARVVVGSGELPFGDLLGLSGLVGDRDVSPVQLVDSYLRRISMANDELRAYITVCDAEAREAAAHAQADIEAGRCRGRLHGIPIAVKDNILTKGVRTTAHSEVLREFVPDADAEVVRRLRSRGMIVIGKTNTSEFACGGTPIFGTPANPWNIKRHAGASSSGSAIAVAAGLAAAAIGSDTGGSIRVPASLCGVVGLKPTYGLVSTEGCIPLTPSFDHVGPIARTVGDAAVMLECMAEWAVSADIPGASRVPPQAAELLPTLSGLTIGMPREHFFEGAEPDVRSAVDAAIAFFDDHGARIATVSTPIAEELGPAFLVLARMEAFEAHRSQLAELGHLYGDQARSRLLMGRAFGPTDYLRAVGVRDRWLEEIRSVMESVDVMITPTVPFTADKLDIAADELPDMSANTAPFNLCGYPALTIPCGFDRAGLPIGMQLVGRPLSEALLFRVGRLYESGHPWRGMWPRTPA